MLDIIYNDKARKRFSGREYYLNLLKNNKEDIKKGIGRNIALLGQKGIGKSFILKEFISRSPDVSCVYIDFEKISLSPEHFAVEFAGNILYWLLSRKFEEYEQYMDISFLTKLNIDKQSLEILRKIENELSKIKPDHRMLVELAFSLPKTLQKNNDKKIIICAKEFHEILGLNNYEKIKDVLPLFYDSLSGANYILTSSAINLVEQKLKEFRIERVGYFDEQETVELANKIAKVNTSQLYKLSLGHPLFISAICERASELKNLEKAFAAELAAKKGVIFDSCLNLLNYSLNRARGQTLLVVILKILSKEELRLNAVSQRLHRSPSVTKSLLQRLVDVDLIDFKNNIYSFTDPMLRKFVNLVFVKGIEIEEADEKTIDEVAKQI